MRRTVAKRLRKESVRQAQNEATVERRQVADREVDGLYEYKKKIYKEKTVNPKLKQSRRQQRLASKPKKVDGVVVVIKK